MSRAFREKSLAFCTPHKSNFNCGYEALVDQERPSLVKNVELNNCSHGLCCVLYVARLQYREIYINLHRVSLQLKGKHQI